MMMARAAHACSLLPTYENITTVELWRREDIHLLLLVKGPNGCLRRILGIAGDTLQCTSSIFKYLSLLILTLIIRLILKN
jgi:hypothetical protein